jgi:bacterioferritin-associated ferredoxin
VRGLTLNKVESNNKRNFICHCSGTTKDKIKELRNNGIADLDSISRLTGASAGCGACEPAILDLLAEEADDGKMYTNRA